MGRTSTVCIVAQKRPRSSTPTFSYLFFRFLLWLIRCSMWCTEKILKKVGSERKEGERDWEGASEMGMTSKRRFPVRFPFLHTPPEFCWGFYSCSHNVWPPSAANLLLQVFWRFLSSLFSLFVLYFRISVLRSRQRRPLGSNRDIDSPNGESYQRERVRRGEKPPEGS